MVGYAFQHLNMQRITLGVFQGNGGAIAVYQKWYVSGLLLQTGEVILKIIVQRIRS